MSLIKNEPLLYRFGFVCAPEGELPQGELWNELRVKWKSVQIQDLLVLAHSEAPVTRISDSALLIGHAFAVGDSRPVHELLEAAIASDSALHETLDTLSGRFVLITSQGRVYHDAIGSRTVFYHLTRRCVASHGGLIAGLFGATADPLAEAISREPEYTGRSVVYLPGDLSVHEVVRALTPNNYYDIPSGRTVRYWPRASREKATLDQFYSCADAYFASFAAYLSGRFTPVLGVTAGLDTRAVIAAFRHHELPMKYVTWTNVALPQEDMPVIKGIGSYLGGEHRFLPEEGQEGNDTFRHIGDLAGANVGHFRRPSERTAYMYQTYEGLRDLVFVRGYGGEIVRGFRAYHKEPIEAVSIAELVRAYNSSLRTGSPPSERYIKLASEAVEQFMVRANYEGLEDFGYDPNDLYYWEHRMGMWGSSMHNEMDAAMLSMVGLNNRRLFETAFGLETSERLDERFLLGLTRRYDEGLEGFAINPSKARSRRDVGASQTNRQLREQLKSQREQLKGQREQLNARREQLKGQRERRKVFKERLDKRDTELKKATRERRDAERERDHFKRLYTEIGHSRFWRYTLPARRIAGALKKALRG